MMLPGQPQGARADDRRLVVFTLIVVATMTALRVIFADVLDLRTDEAYYWTWSKEHLLSFLDHPPMISWFIRAGTVLFGDTNLGARFAGIVAMLVAEGLLADIVWRLTRNIRAACLAVLMMEASVYYGLLMAKIAPDTAAIPFSLAMIWSLVRLAETGKGYWWIIAGFFGGLSLLSKFTIVFFVPAIVAFALVPKWRARWLTSIYPWLGALTAMAVFSPVLVWNAGHEWAGFRFQSVRATSEHAFSLRTIADFFGMQFAQVGPILLPVTIVGLVMLARRGYQRRDAVAILLATCVLVPIGYFLWRSLSIRIGDTWPMSIWPVGFAAVAINLVRLRDDPESARLARASGRWVVAAIASGLPIVVLVFAYYAFAPWPWFSRTDPIAKEAGYAAVAERALEDMHKIGATWIATTNYRTYAMLRWHLKDRVPVLQIDERSRFIGFRPPDMTTIEGHPGLYVVRVPEMEDSEWAWKATTARLEQVDIVTRLWRGAVVDALVFKKVTNWTPVLAPPVDSPLYRWPQLS